ncbi:hypothetical protein QAD02_008344 [Eretmocerus hayati]|uniref:Uncharacterized protein n=1 Tax=Eretmocerus hayati TaxID=131215 RepID=A0ACC2N6J8_9HYME|nr:hypothetical protein QAD02_008344 [Eretmocerus hayati]
MAKKLAPTGSRSVMSFINHLDEPTAERTEKINSIRYFCYKTDTPRKWQDDLNLTPPSGIYEKIIKDRCLYDSARQERLRSNNSYAVIKDGRYVRFRIKRVSREKVVIGTECIEGVCVFVQVKDAKYACAVLHPYYYW